MKKAFLALALIMLAGGAILQGQEVYKYWVAFADKEGSPYNLDEPSGYLSPRAIERRQRLGIDLDSLDLPVSPRYIAALQQEGFIVQNRSKWLNGVVLFSRDSVGMDAFARFPFVDTVILCDRGGVAQPDTEVFNIGYPLDRFPFPEPFSDEYYGAACFPIKQLRGHYLHRGGYQGQGVVIGVCDCGFPGVDTTAIFEPMRSEGRLLATRDFVWANENNVYTIHSHGTHVLSTMAVFEPGMYVGTAPKASYVLCRTENVFSETPLEEYNWVAAAEYLDSLGADIISTSLGYFNYDDSTRSYSLSDLDGTTAPISCGSAIAVSRGMLVINAAGNDGQATPQHLNVPADTRTVLTVGAVDTLGVRADFSAHGSVFGSYVKPDVMAMGVDVVSASPDGLFRLTNGTSLSCPIMAGMMACLMQCYPNRAPQRLCDMVRSWGSLADHPDPMSGYGIPDFGRAVGAPVAIGTCADGQPFQLYPNPASHWVVLSLGGQTKDVLLVVTDMMGRTMLNQRVNTPELRFSIDAWPSGTYFVNVNGKVAKMAVVTF